MTLATNEGKTLVLKKVEIDSLGKNALSTMPEGIEKRLTEREFVDLIAFLLSQTQPEKP